MLATAVYNMKTQQHLNIATIPVIGLGLIFNQFFTHQFIDGLLGMAVLGIPILICASLNLMGMGDFKYMIGIGLFLGFKLSLICLIISSLEIAIAVLIYKYLLTKGSAWSGPIATGFFWFVIVVLSIFIGKVFA